jgi:predicted glycosyltransferase
VSAAIDAARRCHPAVRVLCSLRDVVRQSKHERVDHEAYLATVLDALGARFDGILVHGDPAFTRFEEHFDGRTALPVAYTGFVTELADAAPSPVPSTPYAVLSCGGGARHRAFLLAAIEAFRRLAAQGPLGLGALIVFPAAFADDAELEAIESAAGDGPVHVRRFGPEFEHCLAGSTVSISRAGYNTCAALLAAHVRAVLVPDPDMSDQGIRAARLATLGIATLVDGDETSVAALMTAIRSALTGQPPRHSLAVDGVVRTRELVETAETWTRSRGQDG